ncbi:PVC-type heme-binding CxxCH protein [Sphingobacterium sp.]|uniref:PVC-type heme-binding CxxCH protein n=1 Tax=Sphingobacterium sp. TaxID=341027 RepID=UPI00289B2041|nr:PVC-type heme-binding CxxCH protein [Sphingobacterium sp.]
MRHPILAASLLVLLVGCKQKHENERIQQALDAFQLEEGLRIEPVAYEPMVIDPVAFAFDENRRMYVVEDRGYPDPAEEGEPTTLGRIVLLEDTDGDGTYDKRNEFATGLTYPNGILPWKGGVFITCAPHIYYYKDSDGDGVADIKKTVLTGFNDTKTSQIRMSHPTLGLDGWVYVTGGLNGGNITSPEHPDRPAATYTAADGRFNPETFEFQVTGGKSQFGLTMDPYGHRFGTSNRHPVMQIVMEPWNLSRNPHLTFNEMVQNVSPVEANAVVYPISNAVTTAEYIPDLMGKSHTGTFTAASGLVVYNGTALKPEHKGNIFICESAQNLVQRQIVKENGASFTSAIANEGKEFLASTDEWFRPVYAQHGPEGALYIVDMHRKVIDHPAYVPEEMRGQLDFEAGKTDGRIYKVVRGNFDKGDEDKTGKVAPGSTNKDLVDALSSADEWKRATAFRLLLESKPADIADLLKETIAKSSNNEGKARALWLAHNLGMLSLESLNQALASEEASIREQAVQILASNTKYDQAKSALNKLAEDPSARVRYYSAIALGNINTNEAVQALAKIAAKDGADKWSRAAVLSGLSGRSQEFITAFTGMKSAEPKAYAAVMQDLGRLLGHGGTIAEASDFFHRLVTPDAIDEWKISAMLGLSEALNGRKQELKPNNKGLLYAVNSTSTESLDSFVGKIKEIALKDTADKQSRAISLLGYTSYEQSNDALRQLLSAHYSPQVQIQAINSIAKLQDPKGAELLADKAKWKAYSPKVKPTVISALISNTSLLPVLFKAIESGQIAAAEISSIDRTRLMKSKDKAIADRATVLFKELEGGDRMAVYEEYKNVLRNAKPVASAGAAIFQAQCAVCHTYGGKGGQVGPDLSGIKNQPADALLLHILAPNYEVYPQYQSVIVKTKDGSTKSGWVVSETDNGLTLRTATGADEAVLRSNIETLTNSGLSLMPDGMEKAMSKEDMANLIEYLKKGDSN